MACDCVFAGYWPRSAGRPLALDVAPGRDQTADHTNLQVHDGSPWCCCRRFCCLLFRFRYDPCNAEDGVRKTPEKCRKRRDRQVLGLHYGRLVFDGSKSENVNSLCF